MQHDVTYYNIGDFLPNAKAIRDIILSRAMTIFAKKLLHTQMQITHNCSEVRTAQKLMFKGPLHNLISC